MPYLAPTDSKTALAFLHERHARIIAGCTDFLPGRKSGQVDEALLDISAVTEFRGVTKSEGGWCIGSATPWSEIINTPLPAAFDGLKQAARQVGSVQIQNRGTIAGNLCNASPAADGVPPLLALEAEVEIVSLTGTRRLPLGRFIRGVRSVDLSKDEIVSAIYIPDPPKASRSAFLKLGSRAHLVISIAMAAAVIEAEAGIIRSAKLAVGSCSPVAQRLPVLEARLVGKTASQIRTMDFSSTASLAPLSPISDVRGTSDYRLDVAAEICRRVTLQALGPAGLEG